uniref:Uncharacterized protein n=1 Tax=Ditylenchus dipsaci TaxID=166011 RepID=A0A915D620_9BILA
MRKKLVECGKACVPTIWLQKRKSSCYAMVNSTFNSHPINPEERLMLTLRFLATGEAFRSLSFQSVLVFQQSPNSVFNMLRNLQCSQNRLSSSACYRRGVDRYCSKVLF